MKAFSQSRILGGAVVLSLTQLGASLVGFVRERVLVQTFPALGITDVYYAAFRPSDLLFQVCIMAGYSVALVPLLAKYHAHDDREGMGKLLNGTVGLAALLFGAIALLVGLAFPQIAPFLTNFSGEQLDLYIYFGQLALLTNFLFVFGNAFGQYLITVQKYWVYGITPILYTLGTIGGTLYLTPYAGAYGPIYGTLLGGIAYILFRGIAVLVHGWKPRLQLWHPDLRELGILMVPRMMALGALQLQLLLFDKVASGLEGGSVTINALARNVQSAAVGVAGIALAQSAFSLLSQAAAKGEQQRYWIYLRRGIGILLLITIPGAVAAVILAPFIGSVLFDLELAKVSVFSLCLLYYAVSIPCESLNHLLLRSFYALKNTYVPAVFSVLNGFLAIGIAFFLAPTYGVYSLPMGFAAGQGVQMLGLWALLPRSVKNM